MTIELQGLRTVIYPVADLAAAKAWWTELIGVITPQTLLKGWRYAIMVCFVVAAVITPSGDPYSMLALALPMTLFYLVSVLIGWIVQRARLKRDAASS